MKDVLKALANKLENQGLYYEADCVDLLMIKMAQATTKADFVNNLPSIVKQHLISVLAKNPQFAKQLAGLSKNVTTPALTNSLMGAQSAPATQPQSGKSYGMGNYSHFVNFLNNVEGGISNRKKNVDSGGLTNRGITQSAYNDYRKRNRLPSQPVTQMSDQERNNIIKNSYWDTVKGDYLPAPVAVSLADWKFNGGSPVRSVQKMLKLPITGTMDTGTIRAIWNQVGNDPQAQINFAKQLNDERMAYLQSLRTTVKGKRVPLINYNRGWYNRLNTLEDHFSTLGE